MLALGPAHRMAGSLDPAGVTAVDAHTVRFRLKRPDSAWPVAVGYRHTSIIPAGTNEPAKLSP